MGLAAAGAALLAAWRFGRRETPVFLAFLFAAALLPVSSMTEGSRYLYLASVPVAITVAWGVSASRGRTTAAAYTLLAIVFVAFGWQVREKGRDWLWASDMTAQAVATIVDGTGPGCRGAQVYLATAPVRIRGVDRTSTPRDWRPSATAGRTAWRRSCASDTTRRTCRRS